MEDNEKAVFEYDGLTYIPVRMLLEEEDIEIMISRSPKEIWKNAIIEKPKNGDDYTQKDFYACSGTSGYELFYCIERGIFVTPVERGIINLSEVSIGERFLDELSAFKSQKTIREIIAGNRPLTFDETKDVALMKDISAVLEEGDVFTRRNETLGDVRVRLGNPEHDGLMHIIKRRMDSRLFHENLSTEQAVKETSAILFLALKNIDEAPATKETNGHYVLYKNGIKTCFGKDKNGRFVLSGFDFYNTKQEAADAIKSVTAQYGYAPEFLGIYAQVGAAYASLNKTIPQSAEKSTVTDNSEVLTKPMTITVNDKERTCRNGVLEGFKNAVKMVDELLDENKLLREENAELHKKLEQKSHKKDRADGWER